MVGSPNPLRGQQLHWCLTIGLAFSEPESFHFMIKPGNPMFTRPTTLDVSETALIDMHFPPECLSHPLVPLLVS